MARTYTTQEVQNVQEAVRLCGKEVMLLEVRGLFRTRYYVREADIKQPLGLRTVGEEQRVLFSDGTKHVTCRKCHQCKTCAMCLCDTRQSVKA